jgi:formamidopyrimidine-DNA glycosylase
MSIELPEAFILAQQMSKELAGRTITGYELANYEKLQKQTFFNKNIAAYEVLKGSKISAVRSTGIVIRIQLEKGHNLLLSPEQGGSLLWHKDSSTLPKKYHLRLDFADRTHFTVQLKGYGLVYTASDGDLQKVYVYRRDTAGPTPLDDGFTFDLFNKGLDAKNQYIKTAMVGKDAAVIGFGNAGFQEIAHQAGLHPRRKTGTLSPAQRKVLYKTIQEVVKNRISKGGKTEFCDIYGNRGGYLPSVGSHTRNRPCPKCGTSIERFQFAGGPTYFCPKCQPPP